MKKFLLLSILALLAICCLTGCDNNAQPPSPDGVVTGLATDTLIYDLSADYAVSGTVKCGYASLTYSGENEQAERINQDLQKMMDDYVQETAGYDEMLASENADLVFTHERVYSLIYLDEQYISIVADGYDMISGAAHPGAYMQGYVYDLSTGEQVQIADLLPEDYAAGLKDAVLNQIAASEETDYYYPNLEEAVEIALLSPNWYLEYDCIWLIFNPNQIAAQTAGVLKFPYYYRG